LAISYPGVGIESGHGEKLVAGLFDLVFHPNGGQWYGAFPALGGLQTGPGYCFVDGLARIKAVILGHVGIYGA
jgi:hypothetical protein